MYFKELTIPENVSVELMGKKLKITGPKGGLEKEFKLPQGIRIENLEDKIRVSSDSERRKTKALVGSILSHINNMIIGVTKGFVYKLKIVYFHFPITVKVEKDKVLIQNFLGERTPRIAKVVGDVEIKVEGQEITVSGKDVEAVGQTAANIEQACRIKAKDRKIFQDGIWIVSRE